MWGSERTAKVYAAEQHGYIYSLEQCNRSPSASATAAKQKGNRKQYCVCALREAHECLLAPCVSTLCSGSEKQGKCISKYRNEGSTRVGCSKTFGLLSTTRLFHMHGWPQLPQDEVLQLEHDASKNWIAKWPLVSLMKLALTSSGSRRTCSSVFSSQVQELSDTALKNARYLDKATIEKASSRRIDERSWLLVL